MENFLAETHGSVSFATLEAVLDLSLSLQT